MIDDEDQDERDPLRAAFDDHQGPRATSSRAPSSTRSMICASWLTAPPKSR